MAVVPNPTCLFAIPGDRLKIPFASRGRAYVPLPRSGCSRQDLTEQQGDLPRSPGVPSGYPARQDLTRPLGAPTPGTLGGPPGTIPGPRGIGPAYPPHEPRIPPPHRWLSQRHRGSTWRRDPPGKSLTAPCSHPSAQPQWLSGSMNSPSSVPPPGERHAWWGSARGCAER